MVRAGQKDKANRSSPKVSALGKDNPLLRGWYAARLARFDLPAALAIAKELSIGDRDSATRIYANIAFRLAPENPAEAERVLRMVPQIPGRGWLHPRSPGRWPQPIRPEHAGWLTSLSFFTTNRRITCR